MKTYILISILILSTSLFAQEKITKEILFQKQLNIFSENGKYGLKDNDGIVLLPATYQKISEKINGFYLVRDANKFGLYDLKLKSLVLPIEYSDIDLNNKRGNYDNNVLDKFLIVIRKGDLTGLLDHNLETIFPVEYKNIHIYQDFVFLRNQQNKEGIWFFDQSKQNIPLIFDHVIPQQSASLCGFVANQDNNFYFFNANGQKTIENAQLVAKFFDNWQSEIYSDYILFVNKNTNYGIYSCRAEEIIIPAKYDGFSSFYENKLIAKKDVNYGIIDNTNQILVPFIYDSLYFSKPNKKDLFIVAKKNKLGLIDSQNNELIPFTYDEIENLNNQRFKVCIDGKCSMTDHNGKVLTNMTFDNIGGQYNNQSAVFKNGLLGYINQNGQIVEPIERKIKAGGYQSTEAVYKNFVTVLKTENDSLLLEFSKNLLPDDYSREFMTRIDYSYRNYPTSATDADINHAIEVVFKIFKKFQNSLIRDGELQNLEFEGLTSSPNIYFDDESNLLGNELEGILKTNSYLIYFQFGELISIDGFWKTFTLPGVYSIEDL